MYYQGSFNGGNDIKAIQVGDIIKSNNSQVVFQLCTVWIIGLKIVNGLLPPKAKKELEAQGIDLNEILKQLDQGMEPVTLVDVKDGSDHVIISLE